MHGGQNATTTYFIFYVFIVSYFIAKSFQERYGSASQSPQI